MGLNQIEEGCITSSKGLQFLIPAFKALQSPVRGRSAHLSTSLLGEKERTTPARRECAVTNVGRWPVAPTTQRGP